MTTFILVMIAIAGPDLKEPYLLKPKAEVFEYTTKEACERDKLSVLSANKKEGPVYVKMLAECLATGEG